jgi:hypothetical protein
MRTPEQTEQIRAAGPELLAALRGLLQHFYGPQCLASDYPASFYLAEVIAAEDAIKSATEQPAAEDYPTQTRREAAAAAAAVMQRRREEAAQ